MTTQLATHFRQQRLQRKLSLGQLARTLGCRNAGKGANRLHRFEQEGKIHPELLAKLAAVLEIDGATIDSLVEQDRREFFAEWNQWANEPIQPYIVIRLIPGFYKSENLPDHISSMDDAEKFAAATAQRWRRCVCLVLSRRYSVWLDEQGEVYARTEGAPGEANTPFMCLGRSKKPFLIHTISKNLLVKQVDWPRRAGPSSSAS